MTVHRKFFENEPTLTERGKRLRFIDLVLTRLLYGITALILIVNTTVIFVRADSSHDTLVTVEDCTTPGHKCYEDGVKRTREAVVQLEKIIIAANFCTRDLSNRTPGQVSECVRKVLK